jgi:hypothetical protein
MRSRPDRSVIEESWIAQAVNHPEREERQADGRIRRVTVQTLPVIPAWMPGSRRHGWQIGGGG